MSEHITLVPAGAGSGKTTRIETELTGLITAGIVAPDRILAVTFTESAAAELKGRLRGALMAAGRIEDALAIDQAYVGTIHGLGLRLLTEHAFAAGRSPTLRLLTDAEQTLLSRIEVPARPERLRELRAAVAEAAARAGCDAQLSERLVLAVDEASANVIRHAYCGACDRRIELAIEQAGPELVFRLRDDAEPVDPARLQVKPRSARQAGGLGLYFIASIMDHWELRRPPDGRGNLLVMTRRIR